MKIQDIACVWLLVAVVSVENVNGSGNKYSKEANTKLTDEPPTNFRTLEKPFRMSKLNTLWAKAQQRLSETKLKSLFSELKIHDKEELTLKKLRADGLDKEGLREAEIRKKLLNIMSNYGLLEHFEDVADAKKQTQPKAFNEASEDYINKSLFKDKKLNKLWEKAEKAGFTASELQALREEFTHHQDKIDTYYSLLKDVEGGQEDAEQNSVDNNLDHYNALNDKEEEESPKKDYRYKVNNLRDTHRDIRDGYDRLHRITARGPNSKEFIEPKVEGLWRLAANSNFTPDELESLRVELLHYEDHLLKLRFMQTEAILGAKLHVVEAAMGPGEKPAEVELLHYENRLLKLRHMQAEAVLGAERHAAKAAMGPGEKPAEVLDQEMLIKKQSRKVQKLHADLEDRILSRRSEL